MTETDNLHTRLDYMEEKFEGKLGQMADSMTRMANSIERLSERAADVSLLLDRSNQHAAQIDSLDKRLDTIEQRMPLIERFMGRADKISITVTIIIIAGVIGSVVKFM